MTVVTFEGIQVNLPTIEGLSFHFENGKLVIQCSNYSGQIDLSKAATSAMETTLAQTKTTTPLKSSPIPASTKQASPLVSVKRTTTSSQKKKRKKQEKDPIVTNEDKENDEVVIVVQDSQPLTSCASNSDNNVPMEENPIDTPKMMVIKATQEDEVKVRSKRGKRNSAGRPLRPRKSETDLLSGQYPPSPQTRREASIDLVDVTGKIPSARWAHSMNFIPSKHQLILYGGDDNSEKTIGDLFLYDIVEKRWSSPLNCSSVSRSWHGATYIESKQLLLVFGGERLTCSETSQENEIFSEIMVLDTEVLLWYPPAISGHAPTPRSGHTCSNVHDDIVVFGGTGKRKWLNTVDVLDTDHWDWKSVKKVGEPPAPRAYHSATVLGNKLVIFGGRDPKKSFNTVHVLERIDAGTWSWFHPCVVGSGPSPRSGHSATAIDASNVLIYGGWDSPAFSKLGYNRSLHFSDAFLLNIDTWEWSEVFVSCNHKDVAHESLQRVGHTATLIDSSSSEKKIQLVLFGGQDSLEERHHRMEILTLYPDDNNTGPSVPT